MYYFLRQMLDAITYPIRALLTTPSYLLSSSQRLRQISLPAKMAILTAILLAICVVVEAIYYNNRSDRASLYVKLDWWFWVIASISVVALPIVLYKALILWLEGDMSPFPDIDHAWKAGLAELERQGIDLSQTPMFMILGSASEWQEKALFDSARLSLNVREIPKGPAALHWYGNADGVYLVCSDTSCMSKLSRFAIEAAKDTGRKPMPVEEQPAGDTIRGTIIAGSRTERDAPARETLARDTSAAPPPPSEKPAERAALPRKMDIRGTMVLSGQGPEDESPDAPAVTEKKVVKLPQQDAIEQHRRLEYVCRLVRRIRQPLCPVNGILTLLPFGIIQRSTPEAIELQRALQRDLESIRHVLMVRCPATAMIVGLEEESGFQELVRRVGRDRALGQRFGKGFSLTNPTLAERLEALGSHACGAFEDWVYTLFREKGALSKPGNTKLYALLCKIRRNVQGRLTDILANGFGFDSDKESVSQTYLFGGCYFAAVGDTEDRQAFVKGIFDKLPEQQEELEWTEDAILQDEKYHMFANLSFCLGTVLLLTLAGMIVNAIWGSHSSP
jgi:hypothetical protein